jgi:transcriptional antiterminator NusG
MNYYVIQVKIGGEETYLRSARGAVNDEALNIFWPRRSLRIRKKGRVKDTLAPIFPGYIFIETERLENDTYWALRRSIGFYKFLRNNHDVQALTGKDRELLLHFLKLGEIVEKSTVFFDENNRIRVIEGALKGLEGEVVKVDKRKKRAKVRLSLYEDSFLVDFGFEVMERIDGVRSNEE